MQPPYPTTQDSGLAGAPGKVPAPGEIVLRAIGLRRAFGRVQALDGLDLTVRAGEIYGFLGVNGAGKTTAIRMLMGIIKPDGGVIELLGEQTKRTTLRQKQSIGYVSQEQNFYPWMTCRGLGQFVGGLYPTWDTQEFDRLLRLLDLPADRKASHLSGGMRMKLALALALAPRPALLILDEPTSGLDPLARREFLDIIQGEARQQGRTTLFSTHIIGEVERVADRIGIIHGGRMRFEGALTELRASVRRVLVPVPTKPAGMPPPLPGTPVQTGGVEIPSTPLDHSDLPWSPPMGFQILTDEAQAGVRSVVMRAAAEDWERFCALGGECQELSVEDAFVAIVGRGAIVA